MSPSHFIFTGQPGPRPEYRSSDDAQAEVDAAEREWHQSSGRLRDARSRLQQADAELAACDDDEDEVARLWAQGRSREADKLQADIDVRRPKAQAAKALAQRQVPAAKTVVAQAKAKLEATKRELLPHLTIDLENGPVAAFEAALARTVAALSELYASHAAVEGAYGPLKDAYKSHVQLPGGDRRLADVIRVPQLPIDRSAVSALASFDVRPPAMRAVLDEFSPLDTEVAI